MQHLEGSGTPVLYIGRMVLKGEVHNIPVRLATCVLLYRLLVDKTLINAILIQSNTPFYYC